MKLLIVSDLEDISRLYSTIEQTIIVVIKLRISAHIERS